MKIIIVIPTYNEKENIEKLIKEILGLRLGAEILIIDDNSPDGTGEIVEQFSRAHPEIKVIHRPKKLGLGSAYKVGFRKALETGADCIISMDADFSHPPKDIPLLIEKMEEFDVVIGSRYYGEGKIIGFNFWRHFLSRTAQFFSRKMLGLKIHDSTTAFRCFKRKVIESINFDEILAEGYSFLIEMIYLCQKKGFKIGEIPSIFEARKQGKSKISRKEIFKALLTVLRLRFSK